MQQRYLAVPVLLIVVLQAGCFFGLDLVANKIERARYSRAGYTDFTRTFRGLRSPYVRRMAADQELGPVFASISDFLPVPGPAAQASGDLLANKVWFDMTREQRDACVRKAAKHLVAAMDEVGAEFVMSLNVRDDRRATLAEILADRWGYRYQLIGP